MDAWEEDGRWDNKNKGGFLLGVTITVVIAATAEGDISLSREVGAGLNPDLPGTSSRA